MDIGKFSDPSFIKQLREKNEDDWIKLFEAVGPKLGKAISNMLITNGYNRWLDVECIVEDIIHTTFTNAYEKIHQCDLQKGALLPWLRAIANNALNDELRKLKNTSFSALPDDNSPNCASYDLEKLFGTDIGTTDVDKLCCNIGLDPSILTIQDKIYIEAFFIHNVPANILAEQTGRKAEAIRQAKKRLIAKLRRLLEEKAG
ncbi:MAG: sigma-70 family RNA polymerase sigma factor [Smithella sp.]